MRVVAGELGGRRLVAPPGTTTRPTSDRVRQATFNALESMGAVEGASVVDLFAGSGALGIEALSRGAAHATFVERDRAALVALRANLAALGLGADRAAVRAATADAFDAPVDLALLDPPYDFHAAAWTALLERLDAAVAVCESSSPVDPPPPWLVARSKAYGGTVVTICVRGASR